MNRQGFFTMRGIREGNHEVDLLGVRPANGGLEGWHVEVQVSFRPVGYIAPLTEAMAYRMSKKRGSAAKRTPEKVADATKAWVSKKFASEKKVNLRNSLWPGLVWKYYLVHGVLRDEKIQRAAIGSQEVNLVRFSEVLEYLCPDSDDIGLTAGSAGDDMAEIVKYYGKYLHDRQMRSG